MVEYSPCPRKALSFIPGTTEQNMGHRDNTDFKALVLHMAQPSLNSYIWHMSPREPPESNHCVIRSNPLAPQVWFKNQKAKPKSKIHSISLNLKNYNP